MGQRRGLKNPWAGEEDVFLIHPPNGLNGLILNWCIGGCWFIPVMKIYVATVEALRKKERQGETQEQSKLMVF